MGTKRTLFELTTGEGATRAYNVRRVEIDAAGNLVLDGFDSDPQLESFIGSSDWEGTLRVAAPNLARVCELLAAEFGPAGDVLDLLEKGFGGRLNCMTKFGEWLRAKGIPVSESSE
jgi:hypothetical protein